MSLQYIRKIKSEKVNQSSVLLSRIMGQCNDPANFFLIADNIRTQIQSSNVLNDRTIVDL